MSPVFGDLRGLPPTLLIVGASDVLLEDNLVMAARLAAAGVEVDLRVYPESPHGFTGHPTGMARAALTDRDSWLAERLAGRHRDALPQTGGRAGNDKLGGVTEAPVRESGPGHPPGSRNWCAPPPRRSRGAT